MSILSRLKRLESKRRIMPMSMFRLENGTSVEPEEDPLTYLLRNGLQISEARIVAFVREQTDDDVISLSVNSFIDDYISGEAE